MSSTNVQQALSNNILGKILKGKKVVNIFTHIGMQGNSDVKCISQVERPVNDCESEKKENIVFSDIKCIKQVNKTNNCESVKKEIIGHSDINFIEQGKKTVNNCELKKQKKATYSDITDIRHVDKTVNNCESEKKENIEHSDIKCIEQVVKPVSNCELVKKENSACSDNKHIEQVKKTVNNGESEKTVQNNISEKEIRKLHSDIISIKHDKITETIRESGEKDINCNSDELCTNQEKTIDEELRKEKLSNHCDITYRKGGEEIDTNSKLEKGVIIQSDITCINQAGRTVINCESEKDLNCSSDKKCIKQDATLITSDSEKQENNTSKVIVQVLPQVGLGHISALVGYEHLKKSVNPKTHFTLSALTQVQMPENVSDKESNLGKLSLLVENIDNENELSNAGSFSNKHKMILPESPEVRINKDKTQEKNITPGRGRSTMKRRKKSTVVIYDASNNVTQKSLVGNFSIHPGIGIKLGDIPFITSKVMAASAQVIRILHYTLFGVYGLTSSELVLEQSRKNILLFSGFPFNQESTIFPKKRKTLLNLPYPLLECIHNILINGGPRTKPDIVEALLNFLKNPTVEPRCNESEHSEVEMSSGTEDLKRKALQGRPIVKLQRLNKTDVKKLVHVVDSCDPEKMTNPISKLKIVRLKNFPDIVNNIKNARRRIINLLHSLMYRRPGSEIANRENILKFCGFKYRPKKFVFRRMAFLKRLRQTELWQLCDVFGVRAKSGTKTSKIKKIMQFLQDPAKYYKKAVSNKIGKRNKTVADLKLESNTLKSKEENLEPAKATIKISNVETIKEEKFEASEDMKLGQIETNKEKLEPPKATIKLGKIENICSNVECASPEDLTELNDLLYVKPCDSSEIHQKILDFTPFTFNINSFDFHYRQTLLHYMNSKTIRKIARILDIEGWEEHNNVADLALSILKFLMNMKMPDKKKKAALELKQKRRPHIMKVHSSFADKSFNRKRSDSPEHMDSTYGSEEVYDRLERSSTPIYSTESPQHSRYRYRKSALSVKNEQILNDSTSLLDYMHHPTENELVVKVHNIISSSMSITMGDLVKEVLNCYPDFNLHYRIEFIKSVALQILQQFRVSAINFHD